MKTKTLIPICICAIFTVYLSYARWPSVDPHAENYYPQSPYAFSSNNPINRVDKDGKADDWVRNIQDDKYVWMDNVTSASNTPQGYVYVGANNNDILGDMGVAASYQTQSDTRVAVMTGGGGSVEKNVASNTPASTALGTGLSQGVIGGGASNVQANLGIGVNVSYGASIVNNVSGRTFEGVTVTSSLSQSTAGGVEGTKGGLTVAHGGQNYYGYNTTPSSSIHPAGYSIAVASVTIPASQISSTNYMQSATVTAGTTNNNVIFIKPVSHTWVLQVRPSFRPSK